MNYQVEIRWGTRLKSSGAVLERKSYEDCLEDFEDFDPARIEIVTQVVQISEWQTFDQNS